MPDIHSPNIVGPIELAANPGIAGQVLTSAGPGLQAVWSIADMPIDPLAIMQGIVPGYYLENIFGKNSDVDTPEDVWEGGGDYAGFPLTTLETVSVLSSSALDTAAGTGARTVRIYGLDGAYALQTEDVILNGVTPVATVNTYRRVYRVEVLTAGTGTFNAGTITIRHTTTVANVFSIIPIGIGRSEAAVYTVPAGKTGYITVYRAGCSDSTANKIEIALKVRPFGGATVQLRSVVTADGDTIEVQVLGGLRFEAQTDIVLRVTSVQNPNAAVIGSFGILVTTP